MMHYLTSGAMPGEQPITHQHLPLLPFTFKPTMQAEQLLIDLHSPPGGSFRLGPTITPHTPLIQQPLQLWGILEPAYARLPVGAGFAERGQTIYLPIHLLPPSLEPGQQFTRRLRWFGQFGALHLE